jgi:hypothetical protein
MSTEILGCSDTKKELEEVIERLTSGSRDPKMIQRSRERMDRLREDLRQRIGTVEVAVELVRGARNP